MPPIDLTTARPSQLKELAKLPEDRQEVLRQNRDFYEGDHWQNQKQWGGPWPKVPEGATREKADVVVRFQQEIARTQVTVNAIKEVVDRESGAAVGIEPTWSFGPTVVAPVTPIDPNAPPVDPAIAQRATEQSARAKSLNDDLTVWWDEKGVHQHLQKLADRLLYGASDVKGQAEAGIRLFIPAAMLENEIDNDGKATGRRVLRVADRRDALSKIHVETFDADQGRVVQDRETLAPIGVKATTIGDEEVVELAYLDANRKTVLATVRNDPTKTVSRAFDLGGRLTMISITRAEFLTEQVRQNQRALNFAAFVIRRNNETAGFAENTVLNAEIPGHFEGEGDQRKFVPDPIRRGPTSFNAYRGIPIYNEQDQIVGYTTPSIDHRNPVDPSPTIKGKAEHYSDILGAVSQRHILLSDVVASAPSREKAIGEHIKSVRKTVAAIQRAGRAVIEAAAAFADALTSESGTSTVLEGLRATFTCTIDIGPVTADVRAQNLAELSAGALSLESAIEQNGHVDVDAELARIRSQGSQGLDAELKRAQIFGAWVNAGVGEREAGKRAGLTPEEVDALITSPTDTTTVTQ